MDCSTPGFPVLHHLPEFAQTHVHRVSDAIHLIMLSSLATKTGYSQVSKKHLYIHNIYSKVQYIAVNMQLFPILDYHLTTVPLSSQYIHSTVAPSQF